MGDYSMKLAPIEALLSRIGCARVEIATWVDEYNRDRSVSSLGYETPAAFAAELHKQWLA